MTRAGLRAIGDQLKTPCTVVVAPDVLAALRAERGARAHFRRLPASYRRIRLGFIEGARKRPAEFQRRLRHFVAMTAKNRQFGMVR